MAQFLLDVLAQVLAGLLVALICCYWRYMSLPPKAATSGGGKNATYPHYVRGLPQGREMLAASLALFVM